MPREYRIVSADSHLELAPDRWTPRVPERYREQAPRVVKLPEGGDGLALGDRRVYVLGLAITGKPYEQHAIRGISYEGSPGAGSPEQRLREQDLDGVDAEVMFTSTGSNPNLWRRGTDDDAAYRSIIHAYNEFLAEEYCVAGPDRLLAMGIIPDTGIADAVGELEYCARAGLKGVVLHTFPNGKSYPTAEDDRFWGAALDLNLPVTVHVAIQQGGEGPVFKYERAPEGVSVRSDPVRIMGRVGGPAALNAIQLVMAGVFDRFPALRVYWAETQIAWIPYLYEWADDIYERSKYWGEREYGLKPLRRRPSEYIREHCWWGFVKDRFGVRVRHDVGVDRAMWASDFPHSAGDWPHSIEVIDEMFAGVPAEERTKMTAGNAVEYFHLAGNGRSKKRRRP